MKLGRIKFRRTKSVPFLATLYSFEAEVFWRKPG